MSGPLGPCRVYVGQFSPLYTGIRTGACPAVRAAPVSVHKVAVLGQKSAEIALAQRLLGVTADGQFGAKTFWTLLGWQSRAMVPVTGVLDKATWRRMTGR
jgi:Putative peptidoglycan binding domain